MPEHTAVQQKNRDEIEREHKHPHHGATEEQVDMKDTVPQRIDHKGSKVEDAAGTGEHDSAGG